jgi:ubiquinone/menaquinone biosynthesis C-methylase UbiE
MPRSRALPMNESLLHSTRAFWDANPCGVHDGYVAQRAHRYAMEPWILPLIARIASRHASVLEVGCGQGVDSIELCRSLAPGGRYLGLDYSPRSVEVADANAALLRAQLRVRPDYRVGNAERLELPDAGFDAVVSIGVLHHTADEAAGVAEIHRVLKPGGKAYVVLYRKPSPKVAAAKLLRAVQRGLDAMLGTDRCIYELLKRRGSAHPVFGTMFHECFGVPYMKWYGRSEARDLFRRFGATELVSIGANLGRWSPGAARPSPLGYLWLVEATKAAGGP